MSEIVPQGRSVEWLLTRVWNRSLALFFGCALCGRVIASSYSLVLGIVIMTLSYLFMSLLILSQGARHLHIRVPMKWRPVTNYFRTADLEVYAAIKCFISRFTSKLSKHKSASQPPILFLHGMRGYGQTGHWLLKNLSPLGLVYDIDMGTDNTMTYKQEIERCACLVRNKIQQIFRETGHNQITLIGHSRGGVIANYLATTLMKDNVVRVITLGTPLRRPTNQCHGAAFFHELNHAMLHDAKARFLHIWGEGDLITSEASAVSSEKVTIANIGHISILFSEDVLKQIIVALRFDQLHPLESFNT